MSATLGVQTVAEMMDKKLQSKDKAIKNQKTAAIHRRASAKKFGTRLVSRTKRVAAAGITRIPAESLPLVGVTVLLAGTAYELYEACEGLADLDQLYSGIGMPEQVPDDVMHSVCNPELPDFSTGLY